MALSTSHLCVPCALLCVLCAKKCRLVTLQEKLFKQHLRKRRQIMPPHWAGMSPRIFAILVLHPQLVEFGHHDFTIVEGNVLLAAHRNPQVFEVGLVDGRRVVS